MAELAVASALGLVQTIIPLLSKLVLRIDVKKDDMESMRSWLSWMEAFLEHEHGREGNPMLLDLVAKIRKISCDIEDVIDIFLFHSPPYTFHHHPITRKIHALAHDFHHHFPRRSILDKIASIKIQIKDIREQSDSSHTHSTQGPSSSSTNRVPSPPLLDNEMVGYKKPKKELMRRLVDGENRLVTLAVEGAAGSGKTTLVKNVCWKPQILAQFDCHARVHVSQHPNIYVISENLLKQMCSSRKEPFPADDGSTLQTRLQKYLVGKRYLVVLDDIWKDQDWINLKDALPDSSCGSRIIVTTRYSHLSASSSSQDHICKLQGLKQSDAWRLFCRRAFPDSRECPSELKEVSSKIMARCEGLPLAIVAVAGALAQKPQIPCEWERFHTNLGSGSLSPINNALLRSYLDLSSSLKSCFLYMAIFPEDYTVKCGRLIRLWVAEGFAIAMGDQTAEEVAEGYLNQLIHRNLLQVSTWDFDGRPRNCRVGNIVLKFIIQKCKDEFFASIFAKNDTDHNRSQMIRRLSVHDGCQHLPGNGNLANVRSMFLLRMLEIRPSDFEKILCELKLIKVLDVQGAPLTEFPEKITRFNLMSYLSFRDTKIKYIPKNIEKLSYLKTLDLKQTDLTELPKEISNLHNLSHLFAYKYNVSNYVNFDSVRGVELHEGIGKLTNLQKLSLVEVRPKGRLILKDLKTLTRLRKLGVTGLKREHGKHLCAAVEAMESLKTLDITSASKEEYIEVEEMEHPPKTLQRLYLKGCLRKIPTWIGELDYLVRIGLQWSKLSDSPLETLKRLPNLTELQLVDCFTGEDLTFEASGFKKLKILLIEDFTNVNMIVIGNGAMPELKKMSLRRCPRVGMVWGVEGLIKVEELILYDMAKELVAKLRINGVERGYVQHIPLIHSFTLTNRGWSLQNLSGPFSFSH